MEKHKVVGKSRRRRAKAVLRVGVLGKLRAYFFAGILVMAPIAVDNYGFNPQYKGIDPSSLEVAGDEDQNEGEDFSAQPKAPILSGIIFTQLKPFFVYLFFIDS